VNFTPREKKLLAVLGILVVFVLYFRLLLMPQREAIVKLRTEIQAYTDSYNINLAYKQKVEDMDSEKKILGQKLSDLRAVFPPYANYDEIVVLIKEMAGKAKLSIESLNFSEASQVEKVDQKKNVPGNTSSGTGSAALQGNPAASAITDNGLVSMLGSLGFQDVTGGSSRQDSRNTVIPDGKGYVVSLKLVAKGDNSQIKSFFEAVSGLKNKVAVKDVEIINNGINTLSANISLDFYGIMDKGAGEYTMLKDGTWVPMSSAGKSNAFQPYEGYQGSIAAAPAAQTVGILNTNQGDIQNGKAILSEIQNYDFTMRILPYGSNMAPPTVAIGSRSIAGNAGDNRLPVIYGDNKGVENVEIYIEEKDGKFSCKYRTEHEAFPDEAYAKTIPFTPSSKDLRLLVDSMPRKFSEDRSGVNINVVNKTSRTLYIRVLNDDKSEPRVRINNPGDRISVSYE